MNVQAASARQVNSMKRNIVLEHRQALDGMERATSKYASCRRNRACGDKTECLECPAYIERKRCEVVLAEKSTTLKQLNDQIVAQNDVIALKHREESQLKRQQREAKKAENSTEKAGLNVAMKQKTDKQTIEQKYDRAELTAGRYDAHKKEERLSDTVIAALYGIPKSTFEKWKRDKKITNKPIALYDAKAATEVIALQQKIEKLEAEYSLVQNECTQYEKSNNKLQNKLVAEQEINETRKQMVMSLEADCKAWQTSYSELEGKFNNAQCQLSNSQDVNVTQQSTNDNATIEPGETDDRIVIELDALFAAYNIDRPALEAALKVAKEDVDYKTLYEQSCAKQTEVEAEREHFKQLAADRLDANARLQAIIHVNVTKYNNQIEKFEGYEKNLLERVLHLLSSR